VKGITEELIDEQLKQQMLHAWECKQKGDYCQAMNTLLEVLKSPSLADSVIEKHLIMKD
jgi:hypothetical protein